MWEQQEREEREEKNRKREGKAKKELAERIRRKKNELEEMREVVGELREENRALKEEVSMLPQSPRSPRPSTPLCSPRSPFVYSSPRPDEKTSTGGWQRSGQREDASTVDSSTARDIEQKLATALVENDRLQKDVNLLSKQGQKDSNLLGEMHKVRREANSSPPFFFFRLICFLPRFALLFTLLSTLAACGRTEGKYGRARGETSERY